jgi:hypothetical protein
MKRLKDKCHITGTKWWHPEITENIQGVLALLNECSGNVALHIAVISV